MKPRPSLPQWVVAVLIESTAQSHSGAEEPSLRKPNPFKTDLSPLSAPPRLIGTYNRKMHLRGYNVYEYFMATKVARLWYILQPPFILQKIPNNIITHYHHISHPLKVNNMTSHKSCISYPLDPPSNISRAKQYEATGHKSQTYWCVTSAWKVISAW